MKSILEMARGAILERVDEFVAMVEQSLTNGEMKPQRDQRFNGRYAVVYNDMEQRKESSILSWRNPKKEEKPKEPKKKGPVPQIYVILGHDGQEKARGTYEECAEIMGVKRNTVRQWACNAKYGRKTPYRVELLEKT